MPIERETIVTDRGGGAGSGVVIGILAVVIVLLLIGGITIFNGGFSFGGGSVDVPTVTVTE